MPDCTETAIAQAADMAVASLRARGALFIAGNGGSFADALHVAGELAKNFERDRRLPDGVRARLTEISGSTELADCLQSGLRVLVLGTNPVLTSAVDNDLQLRHLGFAQELCALGRPDDVLLAISTSGESQNLVNAVHTAHGAGDEGDHAHRARRQHVGRARRRGDPRARRLDGGDPDELRRFVPPVVPAHRRRVRRVTGHATAERRDS